VVSVLATGPEGREFEPGQGDEFLRAIKIRSTPSFGWEVKPEVPCRKILSLEVPRGRREYILISFGHSPMTGPPDSTCGCQSSLVDKLGVSPSRYHRTMPTKQSPGDQQ
jgi:hypothetical protein